MRNLLASYGITDEYYEDISIHLNDKLSLDSYIKIESEHLGIDFDIVYNIIGAINHVRSLNNITKRKPLKSVSVVIDDTFNTTYSDRYTKFLDFIASECNVLDIKLLTHDQLDIKKEIGVIKSGFFKKFGKTIGDTFNQLSLMDSAKLEVIMGEGKFNGFDLDSSLFDVKYSINLKETDDTSTDQTLIVKTDYVIKELVYGTNKIIILVDKFYDEYIDKLFFYRLVGSIIQKSRKYAKLHPWEPIKCYYSGKPKYPLDELEPQTIIKSITKYNLNCYDEVKEGKKLFYYSKIFEEIDLGIHLIKE
jgi:hypothetical protein